MTPRTEALAIVTLAALTAAASLAQGCGSKHRPAVLPPPHVEQEAPPAPPPPNDPTVSGGFLAREHVALVGIGSHPADEPWAPPGEWVAARNEVQVWVPRFVPLAFRAGLIAEVETTLPRHDRLYVVEPHWVGPPPCTRVVILPGAFQVQIAPASWTLAAGLTAWDAWHDPAAEDKDADVSYNQWRPQACGPYLPALAHELAHSYSRSWLGEGPPGTREVRR